MPKTLVGAYFGTYVADFTIIGEYYVILGHMQKKVVRVVYSILKNDTTYKVVPQA